jgi:hypothetical protein
MKLLLEITVSYEFDDPKFIGTWIASRIEEKWMVKARYLSEVIENENES